MHVHEISIEIHNGLPFKYSQSGILLRLQQHMLRESSLESARAEKNQRNKYKKKIKIKQGNYKDAASMQQVNIQANNAPVAV